MTGGRFEPYRVAETDEHSRSHEPAETWADAEPWQEAEAWDYDEARTNPEAYDQLELRLMSERARGPEFSRFRAAMADFPEVGTNAESLPEPALDDELSWLQAVRTGRFWANALWLTGAACAGVVAGLVSTNLVALALNPEGSSVLAGQLGTALRNSPAALSAPAPASTTAMAAVTTRAPVRPDAVLSTPAGGLTPSRSAAAPGELAALNDEPAAAPRTLQVAGLANADTFRPKMAPTEPAATRPASNLQLASLVEPAPGLPEPARAEPTPSVTPPTQSVTPPTTPVVEAPAADRQDAPTPPTATAAARAAVPPPAAAAPATPTAQYRVQLALLRDEQNAKYVWHDFLARFGSPAKDLHRYLFTTQTAHGVRHLLQVGPFGDQDHAEAMCNKLKERGGDCLVVRQSS